MKKILYSLALVVVVMFTVSSNAYADTFTANGTGNTGTIQSYTVPTTGTYTIDAYGAQGGGTNGGKGARIKGDVSLTAGTVLKILVGQQGGVYGSGSSGGGGGTFVTDNSNNPIMIAGGGGGNLNDSSPCSAGSVIDGQITTSGAYSLDKTGTGGSSGNGGTGTNSGWGGGGGGLLTNGTDASACVSTHGTAFVNGGQGGASCATNAVGGFGGGAGTHGNTGGGGGGGGYSGGGGSNQNQTPDCGGGGGSYNGGSNQTNTAGGQTGNGQVIITSSGGGAGSITLRGSTTGTVSGGSSVTINVPTGTTTNDVLVAGIFANGNWSGVLGVTPPTGWTEVQRINNTSSSYPPVTALYYHKVTGAEPASYAWAFSNYSGGAYGGGWISSFIGVDMNNPIDTSGSQLINGSSTYSTPSITTTAANDMLVWDYGNYVSCGTSYSTPTGASVISNSIQGGCTTGSGFYKTQATAGASGSFSSNATASYGGAAILALRPKSAVTTVASNGWSYNSFNVGITTTTTNFSYFGALYSTTNTGDCKTWTKTGYLVGAGGSQTFTNYYYTVSGVNPSTSYYYCAYMYDTVTGVTAYGQVIPTPVTTNARPSPIVNTYDSTLIDDNSAVISAGVNAYGAASTGFFRWQQTATLPASCASMPNVSPTVSTGSWDGNYYPATYKMTSLLSGLPYYYCFQSSNSNPTPGYGVIKNFNTPSLAGSSCALFPSSVIASSADETTMKGWLGTSKFQGTLIYKGSSDGFTATAFHTKTNGVTGGTITLIKNQINNQVFGGFNPYDWGLLGSIQGTTAFLFNLTSNYKLGVVNYSNQQTYNNSTYGPTWGWGHDLGMPNSTLNAAGVHYTNPSSNFENPSSKGAFTYLDGGGGSPSAYNFTPSEIEIYKLTTCTISKPAVYRDPETAIGTTQATLNGRVNPSGAATNAFFKWDTNAAATCASMAYTTPLQPEGSGSTAVNVTQLLNPPLAFGTTYYYCLGATNTYGTSYADSSTTFSDIGTPKSFLTLTPDPTVITGSTPAYISTVAQLSGRVNPNGVANTTAWFRWGAGITSNCSSLPTVTATQTMTNISADNIVTANILGLVAGQTYSYCLVGDNPAANPAVSGIVYQFTAPTGCIAPTSGDYTISSDCQLQYNSDGVDMGNGAFSLSNTATLTITGGKTLTIGPNKKVGYGVLSQNGSIVRFGGASIAKGPIWVPDSDGDGYADSSIIGQLFSSTLPTNYVRRFSSESRIDCDPANPNIYQTLGNMVKDTDHDGYVDTGSPAAGPQCVGGNKTFNGRVYWKDSAGNYTWMYDSIKLGINDCDNNSGRPCQPTISSVSSTSQTSTTVTWSLPSGPPANSYSLYYCDRIAVPGCTPGTTVSTSATSPFLHNTSLACGRSYAYVVRAINDSGSWDSAPVAGSTSPCATAPIITSPTSSGVTATSAVLGANITSDGGAAITGRGICWSKTTTSPSLSNGTCASTTGTTGVWTQTVSSLPSSSTVYYTGFATNSVGTSYTGSGIYIITPAPVNNPIQQSGSPISIWSTGQYNFGWEFTPVHDGQITELWGYFGGTGGATVYLYNRDTGAQLASGSIGSNTTWTKATLTTPVNVTAGTVYVISFVTTSSTTIYNAYGVSLPGKYSGVKIYRGDQFSGTTGVTITAGWPVSAVDVTYVQGADSCHTLYPDNDNDGYAQSTGGSSICSGIDTSNYVQNTYFNANTNDCLDSDANAFPHQTNNFTTPRSDGGWDYNCDGTIQYNLSYPPFQVCNTPWSSTPQQRFYMLDASKICTANSLMNYCPSVGPASAQTTCGGGGTYVTGWYADSACTNPTFWFNVQQSCR